MFHLVNRVIFPLFIAKRIPSLERTTLCMSPIVPLNSKSTKSSLYNPLFLLFYTAVNVKVMHLRRVGRGENYENMFFCLRRPIPPCSGRRAKSMHCA